jgi:protein TonB
MSMRRSGLLILPLCLLVACASGAPAPPPAADAVQAADDASLSFDEPPVLDKWVTPFYPEYARQNNVEGLVTLRVTVKASGGVEDVRVMESTDHVFDEAALEAARQWRFKPARKDGKKVRSMVMVPVKFSL